MIGSLVTASVGLLGISDIAENVEVTYLFAITICCIYFAQDGASLLNEADRILAAIRNFDRGMIRRHGVLVIHEVIKVAITIILFLIIILSKPVAKALGFDDFIIPVKILLLVISLYLPISIMVDLTPEGKLIKKDISNENEAAGEFQPLLQQPVIIFSCDLLGNLIAKVVSIQDHLRKDQLTIAGIKEQLAQFLGCDADVISDLSADGLGKVSYYLLGSLTFYNLLDESEKGLKKLTKACDILFRANAIMFQDPKKLSQNIIRDVNGCYSDVLESHYTYGEGFWDKKGDVEKTAKKSAKLNELAQIERVIMQSQ